MKSGTFHTGSGLSFEDLVEVQNFGRKSADLVSQDLLEIHSSVNDFSNVIN